MENEIKVGEYIRTKDGYIGKFIDYDEELEWLTFDNSMIVGEYEDICNGMNIYTWETFKEEVLKHSKNLIDLIEEGDYVNNCRVVEHAYQKGRLFVTYLYIGGKVITTTEEYSWELTKDREDWVKSLVTHEQFESVSYKVKGEIDE